ncbi:glycoside hydrolase family 15 protein [Actinoplanes sp. NPDC051411]|uniref:glycoside hydrolase family 15 protein n=1 Tax=Actinoplanes sp. NPDC051411 TaxID=3155522 RepID=UPI003429DA1C
MGERVDGYVPLEDYAVLGDGRTVALVATDGRIDWLPTPSMHAPPVFAAVLDPPDGGFVELRPEEPFTTSRRYLPGTPILETTFRTAGGEVRVTDALNTDLPWTELVREVEGIAGEVPMRWEVRPGTRFGTAQPWSEPLGAGRGHLLHCGDQHLAVRHFDAGDPTTAPRALAGRFRAGPGRRTLLALTVGDDGPIPLPGRAELLGRRKATGDRWKAWPLAYRGPWQAEVRRSALMLKLLQFEPTGAIAAAATTSLPERVGGDKNWDYRYMWVRDAAFAVDALIRLGLHAEVHAGLSFLLRCARSTAPHLKVFYDLDGEVPDAERELDAPGYRGSRPVRSGNEAAEQTQLGTFGHLLDAVRQYVDAGHALDPPTGRLLADLADRCCDQWANPDAGIWELHVNRHYTQSKMGCWVALDRAVRLHEQGQVPTTHVDRWRRERDLIHAWVDEHCWSGAKNSYTFYAGTEDLDAATLLAGPFGFDRGDRLAGTLAAVERELSDGPLVYRYTGMREEEGAFVACSFWMVSALAILGRKEEATARMKDAVALANDVGVLSEQMAPDGHALGNLPQAFSHLALINAVGALLH